MDNGLNTLLDKYLKEISTDVIDFAQKIVRTKSMTCEEENVSKLIADKMKELGYEEVMNDDMGNVIGRFGSGAKKLLFDSHMDTVSVVNENQWDANPFSGLIKDGCLYGRGSVDMKCPLTASVYGAYLAQKAGLLKDVTIYVSASTMEEDYDGEAVRHMLLSKEVVPDAVVICEPTNLKIATGHRGRALIQVKMTGKSCHASNPQNGTNPVYMMEEIIARVQKLADMLNKKEGEKGSIALTNIYCSTASNNSVPQDASIILDRRLAYGETEDIISQEMDELLKGTKGKWEFCDIPGKSWTGKKFIFHSFLPAWRINASHPLVVAAQKAYLETMQETPDIFQMQACTNGVTTAGMFHLPTIVLGPGDISLAHSTNEYCNINSMLNACKIYAALCNEKWW